MIHVYDLSVRKHFNHPNGNSISSSPQENTDIMATNYLNQVSNKSKELEAKEFQNVDNTSVMVGSAAGIAVLMVIIFGTLVLWHCFRTRSNRMKMYCLDTFYNIPKCKIPKHQTVKKRDSIVILGIKSNPLCETCIVKSKSYLLKDMSLLSVKSLQKSVGTIFDNELNEEIECPNKNKSSDIDDLEKQESGTLATGLASITGFMLQSYNMLNQVPSKHRSLTHSVSCNNLNLSSSDNSITKDHNTVKKSQSYPSWNHCRPRPLSTGEEPEEIFSKLPFKKKQRNRMQNESAAAIALCKSRSSLLQSSYSIEDKEELTDGEVIVIYDERTSL